MTETQIAHKCEEEGCEWGGTPCYFPDNPIYDWDELEDKELESEPDHYYCGTHAYKAGFCYGCGGFWGGVESFDFNNSSHLCENCRSELDEEDEEMDEVYSKYPFDNEDDWHFHDEEDI